jgi:acetyl esterase/lipase
MGWYAGRYMPNGDRSAPLASPVFATLADLPPLLIQVGSYAACGATRRAAWTRGGR